MCNQAKSAQVRSMICRRDLELGIQCLGSLLKYCKDPIELILHEDGSLTENDIAMLSGSLPQAQVIRRREADEIMLPALKEFKYLFRFRERSAMGMKLVDLAYMSTSDITMCDTDVCFFRPFYNMFTLRASETGCFFLRDFANSYCLKPWQTGSLILLDRFNAGLMTIKRDHFHLEQVDKLVYEIETSSGYIKNVRYQWFLEQTCWSAIASHVNSRFWDPRMVRLISPNDQFSKEIVGGHFASTSRFLLNLFEKKSQDLGLSSMPPARIESFPALPYSILRYNSVRLNNRLQRLLQKANFSYSPSDNS